MKSCVVLHHIKQRQYRYITLVAAKDTNSCAKIHLFMQHGWILVTAWSDIAETLSGPMYRNHVELLFQLFATGLLLDIAQLDFIRF